MTNTSESPDRNEQAKPTTPRTRTTARSKAESATQGSQDQEKRPIAQRRTASTSSDNPVAVARGSNGSGSVNTPAAPAAAERPTSTRQAGRSGASAPATRASGTSAYSPARRASGTNTAASPARASG